MRGMAHDAVLARHLLQAGHEEPEILDSTGASPENVIAREHRMLLFEYETY